MLDHQGDGFIKLTRFYKFLNENKIVQNADENKTEDLFKQVMISWGHLNGGSCYSGREDAAGKPSNREGGKEAVNSKEIRSVCSMTNVKEDLFISMFDKAIIQISI